MEVANKIEDYLVWENLYGSLVSYIKVTYVKRSCKLYNYVLNDENTEKLIDEQKEKQKNSFIWKYVLKIIWMNSLTLPKKKDPIQNFQNALIR